MGSAGTTQECYREALVLLRPGVPTLPGRRLVAVGFAGALAYLVGLALPSATLRLATKAVPVLCLARWVLTGVAGPLARFVATGLLLSAGGDVLLELGLFLPGLAAFLLAHVAYALAFLADSSRAAGWRALPFALYGAGLYLLLRPHLGAFAVPVLAYAVAISVMMWRAAARIDGFGPASLPAWLGLAGAVLFAASDTLIALDRFRGSIAGVGYPIIVLYWLGQLGIAASAAPRRTGPRV